MKKFIVKFAVELQLPTLLYLLLWNYSDRMNGIPEAILDERKVIEIAKKDIICYVGIYIVNEKYFKESFIKYKFGSANIFRIAKFEWKRTDCKSNVSIHYYVWTLTRKPKSNMETNLTCHQIINWNVT